MRNALFLFLLVAAPALLGHPGASTTIDHFTHEIERRPDSQALYIKRGIAYSADGQYERALADFTRAQSLGDPVLVSFDLGVLHYRLGELDTALNCFNAWLAQFPNHTGGLEYRARLLRDKGDYPASVADFRRVFELQDRPNPGHYISVAEMLASSGDAGVPQALDLLDAGNDKLGLTPQLQFYAIRLETGRGRPDLAVRRMLSLEGMLGESPDWKVAMAELYYDNHQVEPAKQLLAVAEQQLLELRRTPARIALKTRIAELMKRIES